MKKLLYFITCITLFSCSKAPNTPSGTTASGSIQYKVNGNLVVMNNVDLLSGQYAVFYKQLKGSLLTETRYMLNAQKGANNLLIFALITDSLHEIDYHYDSTTIAGSENVASFATVYNALESAILFKDDYFDINITGYNSSRISGTFTAKLTPFTGTTPGQHSSTLITEGVLNNVEVVY